MYEVKLNIIFKRGVKITKFVLNNYALFCNVVYKSNSDTLAMVIIQMYLINNI